MDKVRQFKKTESANAELVEMLEELVSLAKAGKLLAYTMLGLNSNGEVFFNRHITDGRACILKLVGGLEMEKTMLLGEVEIE